MTTWISLARCQLSIKPVSDTVLGRQANNEVNFMTLCEFCMLQQSDGKCSNGHKTPPKMRCVDFAPGISRFCATPGDYVGQDQLKQMATYFGISGRELKRVLAMSEHSEKSEVAKS